MSFLEIFQPGLRHLREEKDRQKMLVSKPTHGGGAPLGIDLDAGVAKIKLTRPAPPAEPEPGSEQTTAQTPTEPTGSGRDAAAPGTTDSSGEGATA